jgi:hypothetical protein
MMIIDAISEASTEDEIYFFLTCYVEAVRYCDKLCDLPEPMRALPFRGAHDLTARIQALTARFGVASGMADDQDSLILTETIDIFGAALERLSALDGKVSQALAEAA